MKNADLETASRKTILNETLGENAYDDYVATFVNESIASKSKFYPSSSVISITHAGIKKEPLCETKLETKPISTTDGPKISNNDFSLKESENTHCRLDTSLQEASSEASIQEIKIEVNPLVTPVFKAQEAHHKPIDSSNTVDTHDGYCNSGAGPHRLGEGQLEADSKTRPKAYSESQPEICSETQYEAHSDTQSEAMSEVQSEESAKSKEICENDGFEIDERNRLNFNR